MALSPPIYAPLYFCAQRIKTLLNNPSPLDISFYIENSDKNFSSLLTLGGKSLSF